MRVLVTGGGAGLGRAIAARFAEGGARVLVSDVDVTAAETVAKELGQAAIGLDVTADADWQAALERCQAEWGGLDVLVNNAGVGAGGRFERIPLEDWDWIWEINLKGVVRGCRTFVPLFKDQGAGHIVNVASLAAIMNLPAMSSYNVTKAGVLSLSETLRLELEPYGVHTTVVCPAYFRTSLGDRLRSPDPGVAVLRPVSTSGCRGARDSHVPSGRQPHLRGTGRDPATGTRRSRRYRHVVTTRVNSGEAESA